MTTSCSFLASMPTAGWGNAIDCSATKPERTDSSSAAAKSTRLPVVVVATSALILPSTVRSRSVAATLSLPSGSTWSSVVARIGIVDLASAKRFASATRSSRANLFTRTVVVRVTAAIVRDVGRLASVGVVIICYSLNID